MWQPGSEVRRMKCFIKGQKFYRPAVCIGRRPPRILRHVCRTAAGAMRYGQKVLDRYQHWCELALAQEMKEIKPG